MKRIIVAVLSLALVAPAAFAAPGGIPGPGFIPGNVPPTMPGPTLPPAAPFDAPPPFQGGATPPAGNPGNPGAPAQSQQQPAQGSRGGSNLAGNLAFFGVELYFYAVMCNHSQFRVEVYDYYLMQILFASMMFGLDPTELLASLDEAMIEQLGGTVTDGERFFAKHCGLGIGHLFPLGEVDAPLPGEYTQ